MSTPVVRPEGITTGGGRSWKLLRPSPAAKPSGAEREVLRGLQGGPPHFAWQLRSQVGELRIEVGLPWFSGPQSSPCYPSTARHVRSPQPTTSHLCPESPGTIRNLPPTIDVNPVVSPAIPTTGRRPQERAERSLRIIEDGLHPGFRRLGPTRAVLAVDVWIAIAVIGRQAQVSGDVAAAGTKEVAHHVEIEE